MLDKFLELVHCKKKSSCQYLACSEMARSKKIGQSVPFISLLVLMPQLVHALSTADDVKDRPESSLRASTVSETLSPSSLSPSPRRKAFSISESDGCAFLSVFLHLGACANRW
jgi:hypothetical protein